MHKDPREIALSALQQFYEVAGGDLEKGNELARASLAESMQVAGRLDEPQKMLATFVGYDAPKAS